MEIKYCHTLFIAVACWFCFFDIQAEELPSYLKVVTSEQEKLSQSQIATNIVTSLDADTQEIYSNNLKAFQENLLTQHPIILGLFSDEGGKFYLYRPEQNPIIAPSVPQIYVISKSVAHSAMATYQLLIRNVFNSEEEASWKAPSKMFLTANQSALESIENLDASDSQKKTLRVVLERNITFIKNCLEKGKYSLSEIKEFAQSQKKDLHTLIWYATEAQVNHWVSVLSDWRKMLGSEWSSTYAVSNTLYVTRRRNILFTILAQFMGKEAINDRLLLFGTTSFTTAPEKILSELTRIVSDRAIGDIFFDNKMQMDVELLGEGAREQLKKDENQLPHPLLLPPEEPLDTHKFPWE